MKGDQPSALSELEQKLLSEATSPVGTSPPEAEVKVKEAAEFAQNVARKAPQKTQVLIALSYLERYGYTTNIYARFDRR